MKFLQYGTGSAVECSEVKESTIPYLPNIVDLEKAGLTKSVFSFFGSPIEVRTSSALH